MDAGAPLTASETWRAILVGRTVLEVINRVESSDTVSIWRDNWIPGSRTMRPMGRLKETDKELLSELLTQGTHQWDEGLIHSLFLAPDANRIMQIPLRHSSGEDSIA